MIHITDMYDDLQAESSGWLFKSALAGGGGYCGGRTPLFEIPRGALLTLAAVAGKLIENNSQSVTGSWQDPIRTHGTGCGEMPGCCRMMVYTARRALSDYIV